MKRIHVAQSADLAAEVFDEGHTGFRLVITNRSSRALESGADLPPEAAAFDGKLYRSKEASIRRANAVTGQQASTHGGPGRGQGIKAADGATGLERRNVSIDPESAGILRAFGDGDLSLGIRRAAVLVKSHA